MDGTGSGAHGARLTGQRTHHPFFSFSSKSFEIPLPLTKVRTRKHKKDALCKTELELMELLDLPLSLIKTAIAQISMDACPPYRTVLTLVKERQEELGCGHIKTNLCQLDEALHGGIPFGAVTEVVGPAGFGKTQFCLMLCVMSALPKGHGGLDGNVIYFDTERKFHPGRLVEIARTSYPKIFNSEGSLWELANRVLVYHPYSLEDFVSSLAAVEEVLIEKRVKLVIIDSIAALMQSHYMQEELSKRQVTLGHQAAALKYIAESFRVPVVVTNQVRSRSGIRGADSVLQEDLELQLTAALGTTWAHSVNIRLTLESLSGQRFLKIAKSPISDIISFPYIVTSSGLEFVGLKVYGGVNDVMVIQNNDCEAAYSESMEV